MKVRLAGAVLLFSGVCLAYSCGYEPLAAAARHANSVSTSINGVVALPFGVASGLVCLVLGPKIKLLLGKEGPAAIGIRVLAGAVIVAGLGLFLWLRITLHNAGY